MPEYNVTATFNLTTEVEPDGVSFGLDVDEDNSSFGSESITSYGGEIRFTVEAENADDAYGEAENSFSDGQEVTDYNSLTWLVEDVSYTIEATEEPMTVDRAVEVIREAVDASGLGSETQEALRFLLALIPRQ